MASKTFSGQLDQAMNEVAAEGNKILFIPQQTVGEVLPGAASELVVESDGSYSITLAYNTYSIYHYSDVTKRKTLLSTDIVVSADTVVSTIPDLIGSTVPVTEDSVLTIQGYLTDAQDSATAAATSESNAAASEAAVTNRVAAYEVESTDYLINTFDGSSLSTGDVVRTLGYYSAGDGGGAEWVKTADTSTASQSPSDYGDLYLTDSNGYVFSYLTESGECNALTMGLVVGSNSGSYAAGNALVMAAMHNTSYVDRVIQYPAGVIEVSGTIQLSFGTHIKTMGEVTQFNFYGMTSNSDCFEVVRGGSGFERFRNITAEAHTIVLADSDARYGWSTPVDSDVWNYEKPICDIKVTFMPLDRASSQTTYGFDAMIRCGDMRGGSLNVRGYGPFNPNSEPSAQKTTADGVVLEGETGIAAIDLNLNIGTVRRGLVVKDGTEGFTVKGELVGVQYGVDTSEQTVDEPGGFIDDLHINATICGLKLYYRPEISIGSISCYKSDAFYDDGSSEYVACELGTNTSCKINSLVVVPGSTYATTRHTAVKVGDGSYENYIGFLDSRNCAYCYDIGSTNALIIGNTVVTNGDVVYSLSGSPTNIKLGSFEEKTDAVDNVILMDSSVDRGEIHIDQKSTEKTKYGLTTVSGDGSKTLVPIIDSHYQSFTIQSGSGAYSYTIYLDDDNAVDGMEFTLAINMPSSTNPTITVVSTKTGSTLTTFNVSSSVRLIANYMYSDDFDAGRFQEMYITESLSGDY